jgi:hypothetical protein
MTSPDIYQKFTVFRQGETSANIVSIPEILGKLLHRTRKMLIEVPINLNTPYICTHFIPPRVVNS